MQNETIILRPVVREDLPLRMKWLNSEPVLRWMPIGRVTAETTEQWFERNKDDVSKRHFTVFCVKTDRAIGIAGLTGINQKDANAASYLAIGETDYLKKGIAPQICGLLARYGFEQLGLNRVYAYCYADNAASIRAFLKAGFKQEGLLRQHALRDGAFVDRAVLGILKGELTV